MSQIAYIQLMSELNVCVYVCVTVLPVGLHGSNSQMIAGGDCLRNKCTMDDIHISSTWVWRRCESSSTLCESK